MPPGALQLLRPVRGALPKVLSKISTGGPGLQVRGQVQQPERRIRLHGLLLFLVLREEVAVRQKDFLMSAARRGGLSPAARTIRKLLSPDCSAPSAAPGAAAPGGSAPRGGRVQLPDVTCSCSRSRKRGRTPSRRCRGTSWPGRRCPASGSSRRAAAFTCS